MRSATGAQVPAEARNRHWVLTWVLGIIQEQRVLFTAESSSIPIFFLKFDVILIYVQVCVSVCHIFMSAHRSQNKVSDPHEAAVTGSCGLPKKVLGAKLWSLAS